MVEKHFAKEFKPSCSIYGIEPEKSQHTDFGTVGTIIPLAVGVRHENVSLKIRNSQNEYVKRTLQVHPLHVVLENYLGSRIVHFVTLDIEGYEREILKHLMKGGILYNAGVKFCQLDVELHNGAWPDFGTQLKQFLKNSNYIPISADNFRSHRKMTFIENSNDPKCYHAKDLGFYDE